MKLHAKSWEAFLYAVVDGEINSKSVERLLKLTSSMAARKGISKILIDGHRVTGTLSADERLEVAGKLVDHLNKLGAKPSIVFVGHPPTYNGLGVAAARKGGVNIVLSESIPDALVWLRRHHGGERRPIAA